MGHDTVSSPLPLCLFYQYDLVITLVTKQGQEGQEENPVCVALIQGISKLNVQQDHLGCLPKMHIPKPTPEMGSGAGPGICICDMSSPPGNADGSGTIQTSRTSTESGRWRGDSAISNYESQLVTRE